MEEIKILPIGTVVSVKNEPNLRLMVISRCVSLKIDEKSYYFEYAGCPLPMGLVGNSLVNFNSEDIEKVIYQGFVDKVELEEQQVIKAWLNETDAIKGSTQLITSIIMKKNQQAKVEDQNQDN